MKWILFYFSDIGLHFEVVEYSSPIKRINDNQRSKSTKAQIREQELILLI